MLDPCSASSSWNKDGSRLSPATATHFGLKLLRKAYACKKSMWREFEDLFLRISKMVLSFSMTEVRFGKMILRHSLGYRLRIADRVPVQVSAFSVVIGPFCHRTSNKQSMNWLNKEEMSLVKKNEHLQAQFLHWNQRAPGIGMMSQCPKSGQILIW
jgi:hypothetical protein